MGVIRGSRTVEIDAPRERCYEIAADIEQAPEWQSSLKQVDVRETDADGRASLVDTESDATVKTIRAQLRFAYDPPGAITWVQTEGDTRSTEGSWKLEDLGEGGTRATYSLAVDPGRMLGMLLRGPIEGRVRDFLVGSAADGLKERAEAG